MTNLGTDLSSEIKKLRLLWLQPAVNSAWDPKGIAHQHESSFVHVQVLHHPVRKKDLASRSAKLLHGAVLNEGIVNAGLQITSERANLWADI